MRIHARTAIAICCALAARGFAAEQPAVATTGGSPVSIVGSYVDATLSTFEVYPIPFADLKSTEAMAKALVGASGTVILDEQNRRLLVAAPRSKHVELKAVLDKVNIIPLNVRIDVQFSGRADSKQAEASVTADGAITREDGITSTKFRIKPKIINESITSSSSAKQTLLVASGKEGTLNIGQNVPYLDWISAYGAQGGVAQGNVKWQQVGAHLIVEPLVIGKGPLIRIRITPELSGTVDGQPLHTRFAGVSTEITVQDGQPFSLGGMDNDDAFYSRFLIGASDGATQQRLEIIMTPHIMGLPPP